MPNINLIAARREEKQRVTTLTRQLFMGLVGSGVVLFGVIVFVTSQKVSKQFTINRLDNDIKQLQPKLDEIAKTEQSLAVLKPRVDTLDNAKLSTLRWRALMSILSDAIPKSVWISTMSTGGDLASSSVNLKGTGPTQAMVGEVSTRLFQQGVFDHVDIVSTTNSSSPEDPVQKVAFEMNAFLLPAALSSPPPAPPAPTPAPEASPKASLNNSSSTNVASNIPASLVVKR